MGWWFFHACSATAIFSVIHFSQASHVFLQSRLQAPFGPSNINQVTAAQYMVYHYTLCTGSPMWYAVSLAAAELLLRKVLHIQMTPED